MSGRGLWLIGTTIISCFGINNITTAQIIPDGTTENTAITGNCLTQCLIDGGTQAGSNLFHSFQEFNLRSGERVYFSDPGVANIFSRVTGSNLSQIFGTLGVSGGDANLFLLNPNGIIFGAGAKLDVNGSFVATTADEIVFGDRGVFSAFPDSQENLALLTVNPAAFFYNQMGQGNPISLEQGALLTVPEQKNILLLGANSPDAAGILIQSGQINAPQGRVELGAAGEQGKIGLTSDFQLQFPDDLTKAGINLTQGSAIDVSGVGGGNVHLEGAKISLTEGSTVFASTLGNIDGGAIELEAQELNLKQSVISAFSFASGKGANIRVEAGTLHLSGMGRENYQELIKQALTGNLQSGSATSGIITGAANLGSAGDLAIDSERVLLDNGGFIASATSSFGKGGNIDVTVSETINLSSSGLLSLSAFNSFGSTGNLNIDTGKLIVRDGAIVSATTLGKGVGGDIFIKASESVELLNTPKDSILPTAIFTNSVFADSGQAGNLNLDTQRLIIQDGSQLSSASGLLTNEGIIPFGGAGGDITINANESVTVSGNSVDGRFASTINSDTRSNNPAGNLKIRTGDLFVESEAIISASSLGIGSSGKITIDAANSVKLIGSGVGNMQKIILDGLSGQLDFTQFGGGLFSIAVGGKAGNIAINTPRLTLEEGAIVSTATLGQGDAGDLTLEASEQIDVIGSAIASSTLASGDAGDITLNTGKLVLRDGGLLATATLSQGDAGDLLINATESVEVFDTIEGLLLSGSISTGSYSSQASPGNLTINTQNLILSNGGAIDNTNASFPGLGGEALSAEEQTFSQGGELVINASNTIDLSGSSSSTNSVSRISSTTTNDSPASNIKISTGKLMISDGAEIAVNSIGKGSAGNLDITADSLDISDGGLNATTLSGQGGNINLQIKDILSLSDRAQITTDTQGLGNGGNIQINSDFLIAFDRSQITANAISGQGGNINITAKDIFLSPNSQISASSQLGIDGEVNITTSIQQFKNDLTQLPTEIIAAENQIVRGCGDRGDVAQGKFNYTGRGGLPPSPLDLNEFDPNVFADFGDNNQKLTNTPIASVATKIDLSSQPIVEARGWLINEQGNVELTAQSTNGHLASPEVKPCIFNQIEGMRNREQL
jgi:filamentous hemagglutinin family protein